MKRVLVVCVAFILVCPPAHAGVARPTLQISVSPPANANGWHQSPVSASITVAGVARLDECRWSSSFDDASGKTSSIRYGRGFKTSAASCRISSTLKRAGSAEIALRATAGSVSREASVPLHYDNNVPRITLTSNAGTLQRAPQHLEGDVSDDYSGPDAITLRFVDVLGIAPAFNGSATCIGCGVFHECKRTCGFSTSWSYVGNVPTGIWTVTASAVDLAGNTTVSTPLTLISLAA